MISTKLMDWKYCTICEKQAPHKRWLGLTVNFLECLRCGSSSVEKKEPAVGEGGSCASL